MLLNQEMTAMHELKNIICLSGPYAPEIPISRRLFAVRKAFDLVQESCFRDRKTTSHLEELGRSIDLLEWMINRQIQAMGLAPKDPPNTSVTTPSKICQEA